MGTTQVLKFIKIAAENGNYTAMILIQMLLILEITLEHQDLHLLKMVILGLALQVHKQNFMFIIQIILLGIYLQQLEQVMYQALLFKMLVQQTMLMPQYSLEMMQI